MKIEKRSKKQQSQHRCKRRYRFYGYRVYISMNQISYMYLLDPLALCLSTLKCQSDLKYPIKIFKYMKRSLLEKTFSYECSKNQSMSKFLIRGYEYEMYLIDPQNTRKSKFPAKFNLTYIREWFQSIKYKQTFIPLMEESLKKRQRGDYKISQRFYKIIYQIVQSQKKGLYKQCKYLYQNIFKKIRIPWTKNLYQKVRQYGKKLFQKYCGIYNYQTNQFNLQNNQNDVDLQHDDQQLITYEDEDQSKIKQQSSVNEQLQSI